MTVKPNPSSHSPKAESVLAEADKVINGVKRDNYGPAEDSFENIAVGWAIIIGSSVTAVQVALCMDWLKTCRFTQANDRDSLVDKGGYTGLAAQLEGFDKFPT